SKKMSELNEHGKKIACQTCHIPRFARGGIANKMSWDWSTAGRMGPDGKPMQIKDAKGDVIYDTKKGNFTLAENVIPEYIWFNGQVTYTMLGDKVDKSAGITSINRFEGSPSDGRSMIWPVKVFRGVQPYDPVNKSLVIPHTTGSDDASYWKHFDWEKAIAAGMAFVGMPFSGQVDFIKTEMTWPINHMVAPKEKALGCRECHIKNGRMKDVPGVVMP
ncbi:MAG: cytochrome c family protein, partial [uncultured bacterium]